MNWPSLRTLGLGRFALAVRDITRTDEMSMIRAREMDNVLHRAIRRQHSVCASGSLMGRMAPSGRLNCGPPRALGLLALFFRFREHPPLSLRAAFVPLLMHMG